jgi:hypothetical protein
MSVQYCTAWDISGLVGAPAAEDKRRGVRMAASGAMRTMPHTSSPSRLRSLARLSISDADIGDHHVLKTIGVFEAIKTVNQARLSIKISLFETSVRSPPVCGQTTRDCLP